MIDKEYFETVCAKKVLGYSLNPREEATYEFYKGKWENPFEDCVRCTEDRVVKDFGVVHSFLELKALEKNACNGDTVNWAVGDKLIRCAFAGSGWTFVGVVGEVEESREKSSSMPLLADSVKFRGVAVESCKVVFGYLSKRRNTDERPSVLRYCIDQEEGGVMVSYIVKPESVVPMVGSDCCGEEVYLGDEVQDADGETYFVGFDKDEGKFVLEKSMEGHEGVDGDYRVDGYGRLFYGLNRVNFFKVEKHI